MDNPRPKPGSNAHPVPLTTLQPKPDLAAKLKELELAVEKLKRVKNMMNELKRLPFEVNEAISGVCEKMEAITKAT